MEKEQYSVRADDPDVIALHLAIEALSFCTSKHMIKITLEYLAHRLLYHPMVGMIESVDLSPDNDEKG